MGLIVAAIVGVFAWAVSKLPKWREAMGVFFIGNGRLRAAGLDIADDERGDAPGWVTMQ